MQLHAIDWIIASVSLLICFAPALFVAKRSGKSTAEFFATGRSAPWWLAGLSMVATTFSSDTPNLVANFVRTEGVAGNWQWWAFTLTGVATVFFYARLWRRSGVLTDLEFYELRYSGGAASAVRGFRAVYLGFFFNCMIMATVNLAESLDVSARLHGLPIARAMEILEPLFEGPVAAIPLDIQAARRAAALRAAHYHRSLRPISMADAVLIASAQGSDRIATADKDILAIAEAEKLEVIALPEQG